MTERRRKVGKIGEQAAISHLEQLGYEIVDTNYRCPLGEIDIIAREGGSIVFVEVRTKTGSSFGMPEESITAEKARRLKRLALYYLQSVFRRAVPGRFDLVAVMLDRNSHEVVSLNHIKNILPG